MKVPLSWISEYIDIKLSPEELAHLLTLAGNEVSEIQNIGEWNDVPPTNTNKSINKVIFEWDFELKF